MRPAVFRISRAALLATLCGALATVAAPAHEHRFDRGRGHYDREREHLDARFHHDRAYLNRGVIVSVLPREHFDVAFGGIHYFFAGGVWYTARGPGFVVVTPPLGVFLPVLPPYYTTLWVGGVPYYYADDVYYVYRGPIRGYEVVAPPPEEEVALAHGAPQAAPAPSRPGPGSQLFIYPKNGQSPAQQTRDRYECHAWASGQTGFDSSASSVGVPPAAATGKRADYERAMTACLEGRGYTVK